MPYFVRYEILTNKSDGHNKFWSYLTIGSSFPNNIKKSIMFTHWGKIGTTGQMKVEIHNSSIGYNNGVFKKKNEGYVVHSIPEDGTMPLSVDDLSAKLNDYLLNVPASRSSNAKLLEKYIAAANIPLVSDSDSHSAIWRAISGPILTNIAKGKFTPQGRTATSQPIPEPIPVIDRHTLYEGGWGGF